MGRPRASTASRMRHMSSSRSIDTRCAVPCSGTPRHRLPAPPPARPTHAHAHGRAMRSATLLSARELLRRGGASSGGGRERASRPPFGRPAGVLPGPWPRSTRDIPKRAAVRPQTETGGYARDACCLAA